MLCSCRSVQQCIQSLGHCDLWQGTDHLVYNLPVLEEEKRRNRDHLKLGCRVRVFVDIDLDDFCFTGILLSELLDEGSDDLTWTTSLCEKVDHHDAVCCLCVKSCFIICVDYFHENCVKE